MSFPSLFLSMIFIYTSILLFCLPISCRGTNETDHLALLQIKEGITSDPLGVMGSWTDSLQFCEWHGVICGHRHSRVVALYLNSSKLTGTISPFVGNLSFLRELSLFNNSLTGIIPPEISSLHKLQYLWLHNNSLGGGIPSNISGCSNLILLALFNNKLVGEIPPAIESLRHLKYLSMANNGLTGIISSSLSNLTSLSELYLYQNHLNGAVPDSLGELKKLTVLSMSQNKFSGTVPSSVFNLSFLKALDFGDNNLEGSLPSDLGNMLPYLQYFSIASNRFWGSIPASISNSSNLDSLELDSNYLSGQVPSLNKLERLGFFTVFNNSLGTGQVIDIDFVSSLVNATTLLTLDIGKNKFGGTFPSVICNFSWLSFLRLSGNEITGQIPDCIGNLGSLQTLSLAYNGLSGGIPLGIGKLQSLGDLFLSNNQLSGNIPSSIGNLTQLTALSLNANNLEGHIPSTIGNCSYLLSVWLSQNNLSGGIPPQLLSLSSLVELILSHNPLTGSLPSEVGKLKNLQYLGVSNTMLSNEIPSTLGSCISLEHLYLEQNFFHGAIPSTLFTLRGLLDLDLSYNNLSGKIPQFLASFPLQMLNLSYNDLEGEVPRGGVFASVTKFSISGNNMLCGGISELRLPPCSFDKTQGKRLPHKLRLIISLLAGVFGVILLATIVSLYFFCHKKRNKEPIAESDKMLPNVSYQSLLRATNGFSSENLIGSGTFGVVYKGTLDQDETTVAIKVLNLEHRGATKSFTVECEVLRNVRHRNLINVITACSSIDHQRNEFKALVFEYMVNGSLEDWLHPKPSHGADGPSDAPRNLNVSQRLDIAIDVAFALEYLHHHSGAPVVHCDLKPSNVLLDNELVAHVGDFGLAKFLSIGITSTCANQLSSVGVRGTIGYAPPEYGLGNELSTHGDIYSFGILLLEMFTGKRPTDDMFKEGMTLRDFAKAALPDHIMEILDYTLLKDIVGEDMNTTYDSHNLSRRGNNQVILEALTSVLGIAVCCSSEIPQERLDMDNVAAKLSSIKSKLHGTHAQRCRRNSAGNFRSPSAPIS